MENIAPMCEVIRQTLRERYEIIFVDDISTDGTQKKIKDLQNEGHPILLIERTNPDGLTGALQEGIDASKGEIICWLDCDLSHPPDLIQSYILELRSSNLDAVIGSRFCGDAGDRRWRSGSPILMIHSLLSWILGWLTRLALKIDFRDWTSGFIVIKTEIVRGIRLRGDHGEYFIGLIYDLDRKGFKFRELPCRVVARRFGISKTAPTFRILFKRGFKYLFYIFRLALRNY